MNTEQKSYLIGKHYEAEKQLVSFHGNQYTLAEQSGASQNGKHQSNGWKCQQIASENGISKNTVLRAEQFAKGVDVAEEVQPGSRQKILSGAVKGTAKDIIALARTPPEERPALVEKICISKPPLKNIRKSKSKKKNPTKKMATTEISPSNKTDDALAVVEESRESLPSSEKPLTKLQTIRALSNKMESVEQVADAEGMLSEVASAADTMIYRLDVCFENYPEFLKNPKIRQKVVGLLQKAKDYIVKLEGEFAYG